MENKRKIIFLILNIIVVIFLLSTPFIAYYIAGGYLVYLLYGKTPVTEGMLAASMLFTTGFFIVLIAIDIVLIYKLGQKLTQSDRARIYYYLFYITVFVVIPLLILKLYILLDQVNIRQREVDRQKWRNTIKIDKIEEWSSETPSGFCTDKRLVLDMDLDVQYEGDYVISGYIEIDETLPAEVGRLETKIANGIITWPYCEKGRRDEQGRCDTLLNLTSGRNRISVEFPGFTKRLIDTRKAGSFPLKTFYITAIVYRERSFVERLFNIGSEASVNDGKISMNQYNVYSQEIWNPSSLRYFTKYYDYKEIIDSCKKVNAV